MAITNQLSSQLRDIKPPVQIDDWSLIWYWSLIILGVLALAAVLFAGYKIWMKLRKTNRRREYLEALKRINWDDPKHSAYEATRLGRLMLTDEEDRLHELYRQMVSELDQYKYKKEVDSVGTEAKSQFDLFVKACDESF
jgi:FtsZ-interacting cell division protein ZipA